MVLSTGELLVPKSVLGVVTMVFCIFLCVKF